MMRIELTTQAWEARVLPLNYIRKVINLFKQSQLYSLDKKCQ